MARETKAQRLEREASETAQRVMMARSTYTERMMAVFARAMRMNFEMTVDLTVVDSTRQTFMLTDRDVRRPETHAISPVWSEFADSDLYSLEMVVEWKEEEAQERERVRNLREAALAKLTSEERTLLNL